VMQEKDDVSSEALDVIQSTVKETYERFKSGFDAWGVTLQKNCEAMCQEVESNSVAGLATVEKALKVMGSLVEAIVREGREYVRAERESALQANVATENTVKAEVARLRQQNEALTRLLENERAQSERAKDQLIQRVSGLLGEFTKERDKKLTDTVSVLQDNNAKAEEGIRSFGNQHAEVTAVMGKRGEKIDAVLEKRGGEGKRTRDGALKVGHCS
jgi:kinesin family member 11